MAGSLKWQVYTDNSNVKYAVKIDESNGEANGFEDYANGDLLPTLPSGIKMRYVNTYNPVTTARRRFYVGTPTLFATFGDGGAIATEGGAFLIQSIMGEKRRIPSAPDTGLLDGDVT